MSLDGRALGPLIGRSEELSRLARLTGVEAGSTPGVVLLAGDAGIGKTRLLAALVERARDHGWLVSVGQCLDLGGSPLPYLPVIEAFGRMESQSPAVEKALGSGYPALRRLLPRHRQSADPQSVANTADRTELFETIHAALTDLSAVTPVMIIMEDVHWADQSTRDLLNYLFYRGFETPVSIVASYRNEDLHRRHPLRAAVAQWGRLPGVERVDLERLNDQEVRNLVRALHPDPLAAGAVQAVVERAEGNAFFTEELVAASWLGADTLPADLGGLLLVRLDQLDDDARKVVRAAAVSGRRVPHRVLSRVLDLEPVRLEEALRAAVDQHVLVADSDESYAFRHALLGEAVYDDLLPGERTRLHAAYVRTLQRPDIVASAAELARHARAAHDHGTALQASIAAGDEAATMGGPDEALHHYEWALELADDDPVADVNSLTIRASAAATTSGLIQKAIALLQDRLDRLPPDTLPTERAALLQALAMAILVSESVIDVLTITAETLQLVPATPDTELRCRVLYGHAQALAQRHRNEESARWADETLAMANRLGLHDVIADVTSLQAKLQERSGDAAASIRVLKTIITETRQRHDPGELRALHHLGGIHYEHGQLAEALTIYREGGQRAQQLSRPYAPYGLDSRVFSGLVAYTLGDWDLALDLVDTAGESPPPAVEAVLSAVTLAVLAGRGDASVPALLGHTRPWWEMDGMIAITAGAAAIDFYGDAGDLAAAQKVHDDVVAVLSAIWQLPEFQARIRLSAVMIGQLATYAQTASTTERAGLLPRAQDLTQAALEAAERGTKRRPHGPE